MSKHSQETTEKIRESNSNQKRANSSSQYIGVSKNKKGKWESFIFTNNKKINLGLFETEEQAAEARDYKALEIFGQDAVLNFTKEHIESKSEQIQATLDDKKQSSQYRGVTWSKEKKAWRVNLTIENGKTIYIGQFKTEEEAARAYDKRALEILGDKAKLNFPNDLSESIEPTPTIQEATQQPPPEPKPQIRTVVVQEWEESEAGWGTRPDGASFHLSESDRKAYIKDYWDKEKIYNPSQKAPPCYSRPSGNGFLMDIPEELYQRICSTKNGYMIIQPEYSKLKSLQQD